MTVILLWLSLLSLYANPGERGQSVMDDTVKPDSTIVTVREVDSSSCIIHKEVHILTEAGAKANRVVKYDYDPLTEQATFYTATVYRANGDVINLDITQSYDYIPPTRTDYGKVRQIMLEIGRLEPGDVLEYEIAQQAVDTLSKGKTSALISNLSAVTNVQSKASYRKLSKSYILKPDGSQEYHHVMELKLPKRKMKERYRESFIVYNPQFQTVKINHCYVVYKNGTRVDAPAEAFIEVLPAWAADAPGHNYLRELVVVHTGLKPGATICLDYTITSAPGYLPELDICSEILQDSPVEEMTISLSVPEGKTLSYTLGALSAKPIEEQLDGQRVVTWKLRNLPASSRSSFSDVANGDVPFLVATTYASQEESLGKLYSQFTPIEDIQLESIAYTAIGDATTELEQVERILREVVDGYALIDIPLEMTGYRLRPINDIFYSAYATQAEKTNLLNGLLNKIGIETETIALYRMNAYPNSLGLSAVKELAVLAKVEGKQYLLSPTSRMMLSPEQLPPTPVLSVTRAGNPPFID